MVKLVRETLAGGRQHFEMKRPKTSDHQPELLSTVPQDDFFIIGPSDTRLAPAIAYRNRLKNRSRSTSPGPEKSHSHQHRNVKIRPEKTEQPVRKPNTDTMKKLTTEHSNARSLVPIRRTETVHPMENKAVQMDAPRQALEAEIQRIRSDLERRKRRLRESRISNPEDEKTAPIKPPRPSDPAAPKRVELVQPTRTTTETPFAPRGAPQQAIKNTEAERRQRSASPLGRPHRTEYQCAYRHTGFNRSVRSAQPFNRKPIARAHTESDIPTKYESEYRREYRPFKYVPVEQLKSTTFQEHQGVHIVPIPRPQSAINLRWVHSQSGVNEHAQQKPPVRSLTPPADGNRSRRPQRRLKTEYEAKFRNFSQPVSRADSSRQPVDKVGRPNWFEEWDKARQQAGLYRKRDRDSHFAPHHLGQLDSAWVDCWNPPSTPSREEREKMQAQVNRPPAGKPSLSNRDIRTSEDSWTVAKRREAMYDSHHVAEILDPEDPWDDSDSETEMWRCNPNPPKTEVCTGKKNRPESKERLMSMFPQGEITRDLRPTTPVRPTPIPSRNPVSMSSMSSCGEDTTSGSSLCEENDHWVGTRDCGTEERARKPLLSNTLDVDPTMSFSSPSPLSVRSMVSSASMASETLQRAKRQRDRMLRDYEDQQRSTYSPSAYSGYAQQFEQRNNLRH